jgi:Abnormal spindle-like microcephaly-assoc'd, ASPM-SPD-2-Hydin
MGGSLFCEQHVISPFQMILHTVAPLLALSTFSLAPAGQDSLQTSPRGIASPVLLAPSDTATALPVRPVLLWSRADSAFRYRLELSLDTAFAQETLNDSTCADTLFRIASPLLNDTTYYWRVTAGDSAGWGSPSLIGRFATGPIPRVTPDLLRFPFTRRGDTCAAVFVLRNLSPRPLAVTSASSPSGEFLLADTLPVVITAGDSIRLTVQFVPTSYVVLAETLHITTDLGDPSLLLRGDSPPPLLVASGEALLFGPMAITDTVRHFVIVRNRGSFNDLVLTSGRLASPAFRVLTRFPLRIVPGESSAVQIRFCVPRPFPGRFGTYLDTLRLESNGGAMEIPLRGESPFPEPQSSRPAAAFADVRYTDSARTEIRITNRSPNILRIDSLRTSSSAFRASLSGRTVRSGDTATLLVRFVPWRLGAFTDTLVLWTNGRRRELRIPLSGESPDPNIASLPDRVAFGEVLRGTTERMIVGIFNTSVNPLSIDSVTSMTRQFRLERWSLADVVRRGDTLRLAVAFAPDSAGRFYDTLVVSSNAGVRRWKVPLFGVGLMPDSQAAGPGEFALFQNYPNPFRGTTTFRYALPERCYVRLAVFNSLGQELAVIEDGEVETGYHNVKWNSGVASGVYFFKLVAVPARVSEKQFVATKRLVILR